MRGKEYIMSMFSILNVLQSLNTRVNAGVDRHVNGQALTYIYALCTTQHTKTCICSTVKSYFEHPSLTG